MLNSIREQTNLIKFRGCYSFPRAWWSALGTELLLDTTFNADGGYGTVPGTVRGAQGSWAPLGDDSLEVWWFDENIVTLRLIVRGEAVLGRATGADLESVTGKRVPRGGCTG